MTRPLPDGRGSVHEQRNTARFFVESRHISWVMLAGVLGWGIFGYLQMPQRKDPEVAVRIAVALAPWPGASAERVEQLVTKRLEKKIAENPRVTEIKSISRTGLSVVYLELDQKLKETGEQLDDIKLKLDSIQDLPEGAGPITFLKDFGDTAALMLTVASPRSADTDVELRARAVEREIGRLRAGASGERVTAVVAFPAAIGTHHIRRDVERAGRWLEARHILRDGRLAEGPGFVAVDFATELDDARLSAAINEYINDYMQPADFHPDSWQPALVRDPASTATRLGAVAADKYSYRELDDFTDLIEKTVATVPQVSKVTRVGILPERVFLWYSQERLASYGLTPAALPDILRARNITLPGGVLDVRGKNLSLDPSGEFRSEREIGDVITTASSSGAPLYLRDMVDIVRGYQSPPRFLNFLSWRDPLGRMERTRAITLALQMRQGEQIGAFGEAVEQALAKVRIQLPSDLLVARTSDQPLQVTENVGLFMRSLFEAIVLVVLVSLIGFWEWRSALLMALSIPITLAMTFGMMHLLGVDLQQVSIATLIIALGLLVDDPVVAGDAIKRELAAGMPRLTAAWLGPTRLATAILFATITNIVAYLPFLMLSGDTGKFLYTLPVVITCSLVASRIVSMTFIPLLGYIILRPRPLPHGRGSVDDGAEPRPSGSGRFAAFYRRVGSAAIAHRWAVLGASLVLVAAGFFAASRLKEQFFPKDLSYLSFVDVWLPEDAPLEATGRTAEQCERIIGEVTASYAAEHGKREVLERLTTFVGGGGPRFWFSVSPELQQLNYAQILIQVRDKHDTAKLIAPLQQALSAGVAGARIDVRQLETGKPIGVPVQIRVSGDSMAALRAEAEKIKAVLRDVPQAERIRDDWGEENFAVKLEIDPDRANLAGITNLDVAAAAATGVSGFAVGTFREGDRQIPIVARLRMEERSRLSDIQALYVYSLRGSQKIPLRQVSSIGYQMRTEKLRRLNQFRTITVGCFPAEGSLPSEVLKAAMPKLEALGASLPPGYRMEIAGEHKEQQSGFKELAMVMAISIAMIYLALVVQFRHAVKPLIVFAAIPYGMAGAFAALWIMGAPFGFMAFLGVASLVGVIVSHIIVLFDFIEEKQSEGEPLMEALLEAGILRLRPVLITVGATVIALFPLAENGGPLWEPMCYAQIGGLTAATFITLLLVPVLYAIFVLDLKLVRWESKPPAQAAAGST